MLLADTLLCLDTSHHQAPTYSFSHDHIRSVKYTADPGKGSVGGGREVATIHTTQASFSRSQ